jgi:hypothetical protein
MGIGPSSKETTLHHYRDPLLEVLRKDKNINFLGLLFQGTPEDIKNKNFVAYRTSETAKALGIDGAIVSIDSWGNSHVDFTSLLRNFGKEEIPTIGFSFLGNQASFVVTNPYMGLVLDMNKNDLGIETTVIGENTVTIDDARKGVALLKNKILKHNKNFNEKSSINLKRKELCKKTFLIDKAEISSKTYIEKGYLGVSKEPLEAIKNKYPNIESVDINIIKPDERNIEINTILDFSPISVKKEGVIGSGTTYELDGIYTMLTAVESGGFQPSNIGSSEGILNEKVKWGRRGTPCENDLILHIDVVLSEGAGRTREGIYDAHGFCDEFVQEIRNSLKNVSFHPERTEIIEDIARENMPKILLVKLVSGLGCLYDTCFFPNEPGGYIGSRSIMDMGNMPIFVSGNEYIDGVVRGLT